MTMTMTALHHQAAAADLVDVQVSPFSTWPENEWRFAQTTAGRHAKQATFSFELVLMDETDEYEAERLTDDRFSDLLDEVKRFVHSLIVDSRGAGGHMKTSGIYNLQTEIHFFLKWMVSAGYSTISAVPIAAIDNAYLAHLLHEKVKSRDEDALTDRSLAKYIAIPIKLHQQNGAMPEGVRLLAQAPYDGKPAIKVAKKHCRKAVQAIPALPMSLFVPIMGEALSWVTHKSWDVLRVHNLVMDEWNREENVTRGMQQGGATRLLRNTEFATLPGQVEPWHAPIAGTISSKWRGNGGKEAAVGVFQQLRRLLMDARDASVCLIQGLVALRISEICGLKSEPFNEHTGLPACVVVEPTLNGVYEAFYITGRIYKGEDLWEDVRWAAGLRPKGTSVIPPAIRAIQVLHHLFKPYRDMAGLDDLVVGFRSPTGLPKAATSVTPPRSANLNEGQQNWVSEHCGVPAGTEISTHMWRKTYAVQLYSADPGLLPAISLHFKHLDTQTTYEGYIQGADPDLMMIVDEVSMAQDAEIFRDIRHGRLDASGGFYDMLIQGARRTPDYLEGFGPEEELEAIQDEIAALGIRSHQCGWGRCLYRPEWSRCGGGLHGPSETGRSPSTCAGCDNLLVLGEHRGFWITRRSTNVQIAEDALAAGDNEAAAVPLDRVAQCDAMLGIMANQMQDA